MSGHNMCCLGIYLQSVKHGAENVLLLIAAGSYRISWQYEQSLGITDS